jgi:hypothetical protein
MNIIIIMNKWIEFNYYSGGGAMICPVHLFIIVSCPFFNTLKPIGNYVYHLL